MARLLAAAAAVALALPKLEAAADRLTTAGTNCVFPVVVENEVQTDCFVFNGDSGSERAGMCYDGSTVVSCTQPSTEHRAQVQAQQTTPNPQPIESTGPPPPASSSPAPSWRVLPPPAPPVFRQTSPQAQEERARLEERFGGPLVHNATKRENCSPWTPPPGFDSIKAFCDHMMTVPLQVLDRIYAGAYPLSNQIPEGCFVGCPVGALRKKLCKSCVTFRDWSLTFQVSYS